jgi:hypothetical protein
VLSRFPHRNWKRIREVRVICVFQVITYPAVDGRIVGDRGMEYAVRRRDVERINGRGGSGMEIRIGIGLLLDIAYSGLD